MIPIGPIVWVAMAAARAARGKNAPPPSSGPLSLGHVLLWGFSIGVSMLAYGAVVEYPALWPLYLLFLTGVACLLFPWWMSRLLIIPLGLPKLAYQLNRLAAVAWDGDMDSGPCIAALLAMLRTGKRDPVLLQKIEDKLRWQLRLRGATVLGHALLAAARGDREAGRALASSIRTLSPRVVLWPVPLVTNEWIMIEAAARGDWAAVHERGQRAQRLTWMSSLLFGVASRLLGESYRLAVLRLWLSWMLAGNWITTWPLLKRGLSEKPAPFRAVWIETGFDETALVRGALRLHVAVLRTPPKELLPEQIRLLGRAWDAALDDVSMRERFVSRSTSLAVLPSEEALTSMRETVETDLVAILRQSRIPLALWREEGELLGAVAATLRDELIDEAEQAARALYRRAEAKKELPAIEEWRQWLSVRDIYERAAEVGGLELRRLAFSQVHHDVCNYAVWLFNVQDEKPIANAIFTWLLAEAKIVENATAAALQHGNVKAGCGY